MKPIVTLALVVLASAAAAQPPPPPPPEPLEPPVAPAGNPVTEAKVHLGKALFWDEQLSSTGTVACGTCHIPAQGGDDPRSIVADPTAQHPGADGLFGTDDDVVGSPGVPASRADGAYVADPTFGLEIQVTGRRARPMIDAAFSSSLFWDGRAGDALVDPLTGVTVLAAGAALETQVLGPPLSSVEMGHIGRDWGDVVARVTASAPLVLSPWRPAELAEWIGERSYPELFAAAFGSADVTPVRIALAIATYERTLFSDATPFDTELAGTPALTAQERRGHDVFRASRCDLCHTGGLLSDDRFHFLGVRPAGEDVGRFAETGDPADLGAMRTPSLRNVALRPPYMHNGAFATLAEVVDFYDRGGDFPGPNTRIRPLGLTPQEKADLLAFLGRPLTDPRVVAEQAPFDRPILYTESDRVPEILDAGVSGSGGVTPSMIALEPALLGNPSFTVAIVGAHGGAEAVFVLDRRPLPADALPERKSVLAYAVTTLSGTGPGAGFGSVSVALPSDPRHLDSDLFGRWYVDDGAAPGGLASSPAFRAPLFGPPCSAGESLVAGRCTRRGHLIGYKARAARFDLDGRPIRDRNELPQPWMVRIDDLGIDDAVGDDPADFVMGRVEGFLRPATSGTAEPDGAAGHLVRFRMKASRARGDDGNATPRHPPARVWDLDNELGSISVTTRRVRALLVEAAVHDADAPAAPSPATAYVCHQARVEREPRDQTPEGRLRRDLQQLSRDTGSGCLEDGTCVRDLRRVVELCNPVAIESIAAGGVAAVSVGESTLAGAAGPSLLCYQARRAQVVRDVELSTALARRVGERWQPPQHAPAAHTVAGGDPIHLTPGLGLPAPVLVEAKGDRVVCLPTDVLSVAVR